MKKNAIVVSPFFLLALFVLLVNDFYLKSAFPNFVTGKISDFAGLFIFSLYFSVLFPKARKIIHVATALLFLWWKSTYSSDFIAIWNEFAPFSITRTIDFSDNIAIIMIPLSYFYWENFENKQLTQIYIYLSLGISFFAFTATSKRQEDPQNQRFVFQYENSYLLDIQEDEINNRILSVHYDMLKRADSYYINMPNQIVSDVGFTLQNTDTGTCVLSLKHLYAWDYWNDTIPSPDSASAQIRFEQKFIDSLFVK
jgi:hypothetical protein